MRTTVSITDGLLRSAKHRARRLGLTLGQLIEEALRRELSREPRSDERPEIPVFDGTTGLRAGIDAASTRSLHEALDADQPVEKLR